MVDRKKSRDCSLDLNSALSPFWVSLNLGVAFDVYSSKSGLLLEPLKTMLLPKLRPMWANALSRSIDDNLVIEDSEAYTFSEKNRVYIVTVGNEIVAIYLHKIKEYEGVRGLGVGICLVDEKFQGQGLMSKLIARSIDDIKPSFLALHTQNQHMVQAVRKFCPKGYLFPIDGKQPDLIKAMGRQFSHNPEKYDPDLMLERGFLSWRYSFIWRQERKI